MYRTPFRGELGGLFRTGSRTLLEYTIRGRVLECIQSHILSHDDGQGLYEHVLQARLVLISIETGSDSCIFALIRLRRFLGPGSRVFLTEGGNLLDQFLTALQCQMVL